MSEDDSIMDEQAAAEADVAEFRDKLGPFVVAAEKTRMAMLFTDAKTADNPIVFANDAFLRLTGFPRDDVVGTSFISLMAQGLGSEEVQKIKIAFAGNADSEPEVCFRRKDGNDFWASVFITSVCDETGTIEQHFISLVDLTAQREKQSHCEMLIDELNHRVKNTLVTVQSIMRQSLRATTDPAVIRETIEARLFALSRSHDLLSRHSWEGAGLRSLLDAELKPFIHANRDHARITIEGVDVSIPPKAILALGIAFHELATNAVKYGALSNEVGTILITWDVMTKGKDERLTLTWRESGGPAVVVPDHKGFGSQVIERGLAHELGADVSLAYLPSGVIFTIEVFFSRRTADV